MAFCQPEVISLSGIGMKVLILYSLVDSIRTVFNTVDTLPIEGLPEVDCTLLKIFGMCLMSFQLVFIFSSEYSRGPKGSGLPPQQLLTDPNLVQDRLVPPTHTSIVVLTNVNAVIETFPTLVICFL